MDKYKEIEKEIADLEKQREALVEKRDQDSKTIFSTFIDEYVLLDQLRRLTNKYIDDMNANAEAISAARKRIAMLGQ
jgi:malate synthase